MPYENLSDLRRKISLYVFRIGQVLVSVVWLVYRYWGFRRKLKLRYGVSSLAPYKLLNWHQGAHYFTASHFAKQIFIKTDFQFGLLNNEVVAYNLLINNGKINNSLLNLIFHDEEHSQFVAYEFINGMSLNRYLSSNRTQEEIDKIFTGLSNIIDGLLLAGIVHRDLRADNFLITENARLLVIDFLFSVDPNQPNIFSELDLSDDYNLKVLKFMGLNSQKKPYVWDDAYGMVRMIEELQETTGMNLENKMIEFKQKVDRIDYGIDKESILHLNE